MLSLRCVRVSECTGHGSWGEALMCRVRIVIDRTGCHVACEAETVGTRKKEVADSCLRVRGWVERGKSREGVGSVRSYWIQYATGTRGCQ
jgi:hypothetical protein